jgi:hypothetical protein
VINNFKVLVMKKLLLLCFLSLNLVAGYSQTLNGAWKLVEKDSKAIGFEAIKLYSNSYFTSAAYEKATGKFLEAKGGTYALTKLSYKEHLEIDSNEPEHSGTSVEYSISLIDNTMTITNLKTGEVEIWEKFDEADNYEMAFCWRIHMKRDEGDPNWRTIKYVPRKTLKMLTNSRYQVLALNSETGQFVGSSGGTWSGEGDNYTENIEFFSKDQSNVGRSLEFKRTFQDGLWLHTGKTTKGESMEEKWHRYK